MTTLVGATTANRALNGASPEGAGTLPSGWAAGDLLIAFLGSDASTADTISTVPANWLPRPGATAPYGSNPDTWVDGRAWCYYKWAQSGENTTPTWIWSAHEDGQVQIVALRNVDGTTPFNIDPTWRASDTLAATHASATVNITATAGMIVTWAMEDGASVVETDAWTPPSGMTQAIEGGESSSGTYSATAYLAFASAPGSTTKTWTLNAAVADSAGVYILAVNDGSGGAGASDPAQNANFSAVLDDEFAVRFDLQETGGAATAATAYHLYAQKNLGGGYARVTTATTGLKIVATSRFVDGAATTNLLTGDSGTFVAGEGDEDGVTGNITIGASGNTEIEFALKITAAEAVAGDFWDLRVYKSTGAVLDTYTVTPRVTAASAVANPTIGVNPTSLSFTAVEGGGNPATKNLVVSNTGGGTLSFTVSDDAAWLSVAPTSGTAPQTLVVTAATGALTVAGSPYTGTITITDATATNSPLAVTVTFVITAVGAFPVEIGGNGVWPETSNQVAPIVAPNGAMYVVREQPATTTNSPAVVCKSTDDGATWVEHDPVPDVFPGDMESVSFRLVGTDIHVYWQRSGYYAYRHVFDTTTDTMTTVNEQIQGTSRTAIDQICTAAVRSDGTAVAFYTLNSTQLCYRIRSTGGVWGTEVVLDSEAAKDFSQAFVEKSVNGDTIHIAYTNVTDGILYYRSLSSSDVLSARTSVATGLYAGTSNTYRKAMPNTGLQVWNNAGADRMYVAYRKLDGKFYGRQIDGTTPGTEEAISAGFVFSSPNGIQSFQMVGTIAADPATGEVYALWADAPTSAGGAQAGGNLMHMRIRSAGGTWGTETTPHNAEPIAAMAASVLTVSSTKKLRVYYDEYTGVDPGIPKYTQFAVSSSSFSPPVVTSARRNAHLLRR